MLQNSQAHLPKMVLTGRTAGRLTDSLNRRQQNSHQHRNDGDGYDQFDKRKCPANRATVPARVCGRRNRVTCDRGHFAPAFLQLGFSKETPPQSLR